MIFPPMLMRLIIAEQGHRRVNLWLPLALLWPLLFVIALLVAPVVLLVAICTWSRYGRQLLLSGPRIYAVLCALHGLAIHVQSKREHVHILFW